MYEKHFGLAKRPFPERVFGTDVFVGPQTAAAMAGLKKALARPDAVVAVSGPAGVGKTALVTKTLEALGPSYKAIPIGRMHLNDSDVLEYLLEALGVSKLPNGGVRRFTALRKVLAAVQAQNMRVLIVVEDAVRLGLDTLAELEALTAADAGPSAGANLLLMGNDSLGTFMRDPQLERLSQRLRHRHRVEPMSTPELRGYLKHSFRQCGGDFDSIFDKDAVDRLTRLGSGIPRVVNNLVDSVLTAVARDGEERVSAARISAVASEEFGLDLSEPPLGSEEPALIVEAGVVKESAKAPQPVAAEPEPGAADEEPEPEPVAEEQPEPVHADPVIVFSDEAPADNVDDEDDDIPELIQDTLPDLQILAPEIIAAAEAEDAEDEELPTLEAEPEAEPEDDPLPKLEAEPEPELEDDPLPKLEPLAEVDPEPVPVPEIAAESEPRDVPDWERDPTLAQLKPDLDALERAMAFDAEIEDEREPVEVEVRKAPKPVAEPEEIPEITLDNAIKQRIESNLIDEPGQISPGGSESGAVSTKKDDLPEIKLAPAKTKKADAELERIASELARAKTIEDVDDRMAETLFGEEINLIASQVVASGQVAESANDEESKLFDTAAAQQAQAAGIPAGTSGSIEVSLESPQHNGEPGLDLSASQRLKTVRALNADVQPSTHEFGGDLNGSRAEPTRNRPAPASIEDQINTSMTQTLKALDVRPPVLDRDDDDHFDDDEPEEKKGGFFSRFRRS